MTFFFSTEIVLQDTLLHSHEMLQLFLCFFSLFLLLALVVFECHDDIADENDIRHQRCEATCVCCVA